MFLRLTGHQPYSFQLTVAQRVLENERLIFRAPTGAGKTWTALLPYIYSREQDIDWADRLIYVVPLRTLGKSLYDTVSERLKHCFPNKYRVTMQTGDIPDDPFFEGDIIFCTVDQLLATYILQPYSVGKAAANVPVGALPGAYIVIDETHLLSLKESLPTMIDLVRRYQGLTTCLFMTATMPDGVVKQMAARCLADQYIVDDVEMRQIREKNPVTRQFERLQGTMTPEAVLASHEDSGASLVICNTVDRAITMYKRLTELLEKQRWQVPVYLLHSRFLPQDRKRLEQTIIDGFGPLSGQRVCAVKGIIVATQVLEAGIDISADNLHTDLAPANAIIQRAGRIVRYGGQGIVRVYDVLDEQGRRSYGPYFAKTPEGKESKKIMDLTWETLGGFSGQIIDFSEEQRWVNEVHGEMDEQALVSRSSQQVIDEVNQAMTNGSSHHLRRLVRNAAGINLLIHCDPKRLNLTKRPEMLSLHPGNIRQLARIMSKQKIEGQLWVLDSDENNWKEVKSEGDVTTHYIFAVSPSLANYDKKVGLELGIPGTYESIETLEEVPIWERYAYRQESLVAHLTDVGKICGQQRKTNRAAVTQWAKEWKTTPEVIEQICYLAAIAHDIGKSSGQWQKWAAEYQEKLTGNPVKEYLAHTDFDPDDSRTKDLQRDMRKNKPDHACQGAWFIFDTLLPPVCTKIFKNEDRAEVMSRAILTAIARHHNARTTSFKCSVTIKNWPSELISFWEKMISEISETVTDSIKVKLPRVWTCDPKTAIFERLLLRPYVGEYETEALKEKAWLFYLFLVRRLRLADWASQAAKLDP